MSLVSIGGGHTLAPDAAASYLRMVADGCPRGITSSTRSWETQDRWWRNQGRPGFPKVADHPDRSKHV